MTGPAGGPGFGLDTSSDPAVHQPRGRLPFSAVARYGGAVFCD